LRYVLDASVALRWYLKEEGNKSVEAIHRRILEEPALFAVPELFGYEVFSVLFRVHPKPWPTFQEGILPFLHSGVLRYPLTEGVAQRAARFVGIGLTGFDSMYAALAEELGACWLTFDARAHARIAAENLSFDLNGGLPPEWPSPQGG
jgi:predicted nucleic acid-binding protein